LMKHCIMGLLCLIQYGGSFSSVGFDAENGK